LKAFIGILINSAARITSRLPFGYNSVRDTLLFSHAILAITCLLFLCSASPLYAAIASESRGKPATTLAFDYELTEQYTVDQNESGELEKIDESLEKSMSWRHIMGRYAYAQSRKEIHPELKSSMRRGVLKKIESMEEKELISSGMATILSVEFDRVTGYAPPPPQSLKDMYRDIKDQATLLENLISEGKICQFVQEHAMTIGEERLALLRSKKEGLLKNLKVTPEQYTNQETRLLNALGALQDLYSGKSDREY